MFVNQASLVSRAHNGHGKFEYVQEMKHLRAYTPGLFRSGLACALPSSPLVSVVRWEEFSKCVLANPATPVEPRSRQVYHDKSPSVFL